MNNNRDIGIGRALLNITWQGQNGDLLDSLSWDLSDHDIRRIAAEAVRSGSIPGIATDARADFRDFVVDRFEASGDVVWNRMFVRPKTPFGGAP